MKTRLIGASVVLGLLATAQVAQAADAQAEQEGRAWFYGAFTAALTPALELYGDARTPL
jgi:hypothetical protein